ncbi:alanine--tRNA ligase [Candidatus Magnetaquicoccus inordinatus]|uniref:alanine--tRNA ligase n=1 Tax=Candidatus Magnetaquicoccus inordinatus TaxID=2496818 RepID=UPI00102D120A|nr:alanine--tRNA ligase [Candidatus Magnetaquicoccus inordinatus]
MNGNDIRERFLTFFQRHDHIIAASSSLVPRNDPTLLFTNAGMNQFKGAFLGEERPLWPRVVSAQKCVRAGGKHNDLENVGRTARHHTFFEMLGNFSFADYFKERAIPLAWEFVTQDLALPVERLLVTVYASDDEAYEIWHTVVGLPKEKIIRIDSNDNFWSMGPVGPCGPCSEIFYDHGPHIAGGPPGSADADGDRFVEIWNLVFMQFDRRADGSMMPLPQPCIDTGAGLERLTAILQGKSNNFDTDLFQPLIRETARLAAVDAEHGEHMVSLRVVADHMRAISFLIADGVLPSNEGRGYVLRRIMRRAMRHGRMLGLTEPFLVHLVPVICQMMGNFYPELTAQSKVLVPVIENEERRFAATLDSGLKILEEAVARLPAAGQLDGLTLFTLYDTYGFPIDLTADIVRDRGIDLDMDGFNQLMAEQRQRARAAWVGSGDEKVAAVFHQLREQVGASEFLGYETEQAQGVIQAIVVNGVAVERLQVGEEGMVIVNQTPFYAESGGQVGDSGMLRKQSGESALFAVRDTRKPVSDLLAHYGALQEGMLQVGDPVLMQVDGARRQSIRLHHSATHLLHHALRQVVGDHVKQAGSLVGPQRLRFDFTHFSALSAEALAEVERQCNAAILANVAQSTLIMTPAAAVAAGAVALFGEKYGDEVRVVQIGSSMELCGGTHVERSGDIGLLRIVSEGAVAAGVRRIEAVCGALARESYREESMVLREAAGMLKSRPDQVTQAVERLLERIRTLEGSLEKAKAAVAGSVLDGLVAQSRMVAGVRLLAARVVGVEVRDLREMVDRLKERFGSAVIVLGMSEGEKVSVIAGVTTDLHVRFKAGELIGFVAGRVGGKGGGRPDMAMGGGSRPEQLAEALAAVAEWMEEKAA